MFVRLFVALASLFFCSISCGEETVSPKSHKITSQPTEKTIDIPLKNVWSTLQERRLIPEEQMTRYVGDLEKGTLSIKSYLGEINNKLTFRSLNRARPAFAVEGKGLAALKNAHSVLVGDQPPSLSLSSSRHVSIVFYGLGSGYYVSLTEVKRSGNRISIRYELIPKEEANMPTYLALIPLGKLPPGHYQVPIEHEPYEKRFRALGLSGPAEHMLDRVSTSFAFHVK